MRCTLNLFPLLILFGGCASNIPIEIREDISGSDVSIAAASQNLEQVKGVRVRWGGTIARVENNARDTWIEIVGRKLGSWGQPVDSDYSLGRFIARVDGFLDPAIYKADREITIYGTIENRIVKRIDEHSYTYPIVKAHTYYLWSDYQSRHRYYPYYYYPYPYYYPYYGFYYRHRFGYYPGYRFGLHHYYWW